MFGKQLAMGRGCLVDLTGIADRPHADILYAHEKAKLVRKFKEA